MSYNRITEPNQPLSLVRKIPHENYYYRLMLLENEIDSNTIQYRQKAVTPAYLEYSSDGKYYCVCKECRFKLPMKYKRFCPNCGVRLREPEKDIDEQLYESKSIEETTEITRRSALFIP